MVVRLVRAGVGALLLLIAVPLALAGGGLLMAMEHRAADDTFTARLEPVRASGTAVVVPDVDALLRADAPFARGGQTTLSLSAVGSGGPLFIGLAPAADVDRYLVGHDRIRLNRVRLARGPLPVELIAEPAARAITATDPNAQAGGVPQEQNQAQDQGQAQNQTQGQDQGQGQADKAPGKQQFWIARSEQKAGAAELTWSPSALRGKHLALVVMRADGTAGIDAAITARLAPAWLGPTTGGLLMLGAALFFLALLTLAWPQPRQEALVRSEPDLEPTPEPLPVVPSQPTSETRDEPEPKAEDADEPVIVAEAAAESAEEPEVNERIMATLAHVLAAADAEVAAEGGADPAGKDPVLLTESELDRPAPEDVELDGRGPIDLPPLPAMPAIELQFTWAPLTLGDETAPAGAVSLGDEGKVRDTAGTGSAAR
ncbi:hypothetical protein [Dactylosporangium sp. CA-233914]|uniref:hypothetical protein n=1 Tax=Dactylosporangium sp. CA-233914 TaxID=3239934 RepID=UPI003D8FF377